MPTVHVLTGLPGSGKTTHSFRLVDASERPMCRVSLDDIRDMLGFEPGQITAKAEKLAKRLEDAMIREAASHGYDVVVDDCNLNWAGPLRIKKALKGVADVEYVIHDFTVVPFSRCLAQDAKRDDYDPVGPEVIKMLYGTLRRARLVGWELTAEWMNDPSAPAPVQVKA